MKTLKSVLTVIALLFVCIAADATIKPSVYNPTKNDVVNLYIDAIAHGKTTNLDNILDEGLEFDIMRGANVNMLNKGQLLDYLKNNTPTNDAVTTTTTVARDDDNSSVVKVEFKYADYTRTDMVTLEKSNGWVITKVQSSFK